MTKKGGGGCGVMHEFLEKFTRLSHVILTVFHTSRSQKGIGFIQASRINHLPPSR